MFPIVPKSRKTKYLQCVAIHLLTLTTNSLSSRSLPDQTWVQCDETTCLKWRKLADGIDPDSLPDKWYCSMNPDPNFKSCDVPEEREVEKTNITPYAKVQKRRL